MTNDTIPQAPDSERAVLSVLLLNGSAAEARDKIKPAHFYTPSNRMIFEAMLQLDGRGIALDPVQLTEELRAAGKLEKIGGQAYISEVIGAGLRCDMPGHIDRVIETATKRKLWVDATRAAEAANNGHTSAQVVEMLRGAAEAADNSHISLNSQPVIERTPVQWPEPLGKAAYYGLGGEIVRAIDPHTEADVVAVLGQLLTSFGNVVGRRAHFLAEADQHFTNSNIVLVGNTSKGRKGTSYGQVRRLLAAVDPEWAGRCVAGGMSSREGNTLSAVIRQAWDNGNLCSMTKNSPARATGAHISIIGHITKDELRRYLDATETANGFANRFLWFCVRQSKMLPEGGQLHTVDFGPIERKLKTAIDHGREVEEMKRDDSARALWWDVYPKLSEGKAGLLGAVTSRAEAQVMRLACLYALLDCSATIRKPHLEAALELWRYAEDSARFIFGDAMGDPVADAILGALGEAGDVGMTRTQISDLLKRHATRAAIDRALNSLAEAGRAKFRKEQTDGRPVERWFVFKAKCEISEKSELSPEDGDLSSLNSLFSQSAKFETGNPHGDLRHHPDFDREEVGE